MPTEKPRFTLTVPEDQYNRIKDYQFSHRMKNQTQAVLALVAKGLEIELNSEPQEDEVVITDARVQLMKERFERLDDADKANIYKIAGVLLEQDKYKKSSREQDKITYTMNIAARDGTRKKTTITKEQADEALRLLDELPETEDF